jgi:hypothetical protein
MERKELSYTNARRNDTRISDHERALVEAHVYQAEMVLRLARKLAELARAAVAAVARVYIRGLTG